MLIYQEFSLSPRNINIPIVPENLIYSWLYYLIIEQIVFPLPKSERKIKFANKDGIQHHVWYSSFSAEPEGVFKNTLYFDQTKQFIKVCPFWLEQESNSWLFHGGGV